MNGKPPINVQDGFFYLLRKDNTLVDITFLSERKRTGRIRRFDKSAHVLDVDGREEMIYKHAIASVAPLPVAAGAAPVPPVRPPAPLT